MYSFFLGDIHFPVTPESIEIKTGAAVCNVDMTRSEGFELLKKTSCDEIRFKALLPKESILSGNYYANFVSGGDILKRLLSMKRSKENVQFIVFKHIGLKYYGHISINVKTVGYMAETLADSSVMLDIKLETVLCRKDGTAAQSIPKSVSSFNIR